MHKLWKQQFNTHRCPRLAGCCGFVVLSGIWGVAILFETANRHSRIKKEGNATPQYAASMRSRMVWPIEIWLRCSFVDGAKISMST